MIEIIREPKVSKRSKTLPFARQQSTGARKARNGASSLDEVAKKDDLNGAPATPVNGDSDPNSARDEARIAALEEATLRADAAEQRLAELEQEVERRFAEATEQGFEEGHRAGSEAARKEVETDTAERHKQLDDLCEMMGKEFRDHLESAVQDSVVEVVLAAAGKFIGDKMADRDSIVAIVDNMTQNIEASHGIRVRVSPVDFEFLNSDDWAPPKRKGGPKLEFAPDERIELGGCIIETTHGELDARLETQLRRLKEVLVETRLKQLSEASS
jgi:flagellar assembly protein FliH